MDIFAHGLWTAAAAKAINNKLRGTATNPPTAQQSKRRPLKISIWWATWWGIFPDLFAFTIPFFVIASGLFFGNTTLSQIPRPHSVSSTPGITDQFPILQLAYGLYDISHSLIVFGMALLLAWLAFRRPVLAMSGWLFHILIDIPTHSADFFPTPIFWPLSNWKFSGISWATPWFMVANYSALAVVYLILWRKKKRSMRRNQDTQKPAAQK